ncbi:MAG: anaerobic glycerol-3-phosphate dehydrogenase subunit B [Bacteroidales bacterium]|nr:anaerobic glycerol-3-phosphate dehydrogenase subunit B [Bacteroidales bacterium]
MNFDTVIIGGGLAGLVAGIRLQQAGKRTAIISTGQNALHFFSGSFESLEEAPQEVLDLFSAAGIRLHYRPGVRLMPLGTFRPAALSLEDVSLFPEPRIGHRALVVNFKGYHDYFSSFLAEGLEKEGMECRVRFLHLPELDQLKLSPSEMRSVQIARIVDRAWEKVVQEIRVLLRDEDTVVLPQVFGLHDASIPGRIRQGIPAQVVFAGTLPPSVPGVRTQMLLKRRYEVLGGIYLMGDEVLSAHIYDGVIHSVVTANLDKHYVEAAHFVLATGSYFSKGLKSNPFQVSEPVFGLDVDFAADRNTWYNPVFAEQQPYMQYGVRTDETLRGVRGGEALKNLWVAGSILGGTRPELGTGAGLAIRSALAAADQILGEKNRPAGPDTASE